MKKLLVLLSLCTVHLCQAQVFTSPWSFHSGWGNVDQIYSTTVDKNGNVYSTGGFQGNVDFDPGPGTYNLSTPPGFLQQDAFVQKLDSAGNLLWAKRFGGHLDAVEYVYKIVVDDSSNVIVLGNYRRKIQFSPGDTIWDSGSYTRDRPFLVKMDSLGNVKWGMAWRNTDNTKLTRFRGLAVDGFGNCYLNSSYAGTMDYDPTPYGTITKSSLGTGGLLDIVLVKISPGGRVLKTRDIATTGGESPYGISIGPNNEVVFSGFFGGTFDFDDGPGTDIKSPIGIYNGFLCKTDTGFHHQWAIVQYNAFKSLIISPGGYIYSGSTFGNTVDVNPGPGRHYLTSQGGADTYIIKMSSPGTFIWARQLKGPQHVDYNEISLTPEGYISVVGKFQDSCDLDPGSSKFLVGSNGDYDGYVVILDTLGNFESAATFGGTGPDNINTVAFGKNRDLIIGGEFSNSMDIDPSPTVQNVTSAGNLDMFLLKIALCAKDRLSYADTACGTFTLPSGSRTFSQSGTYIDTLASISGCDSILTIQATVFPDINPSLTLEDYGLYCKAAGSNLTFQWFDCQTGLDIPNATDSIYLPTYNGQFAVLVSNGPCSDTSACLTVANASISEDFLSSQVNLFPNPTAGWVQIESSIRIESIEVVDLQGRVLIENQTSEFNSIDLTDLLSGVYLFRIFTREGVVTKKVVLKNSR
ncbi:MAG: T9SS type A sorting domain-containing protein [Bacteroidota bacterium]|nr:T9SS type A sorting domain-containing protein [Bacteroidota bacterium]